MSNDGAFERPKRCCTSKVVTYNETTLSNQELDRAKYEEFLKMQKKNPTSRQMEMLNKFYHFNYFDPVIGKRRSRTVSATRNQVHSSRVNIKNNDVEIPTTTDHEKEGEDLANHKSRITDGESQKSLRSASKAPAGRFAISPIIDASLGLQGAELRDLKVEFAALKVITFQKAYNWSCRDNWSYYDTNGYKWTDFDNFCLQSFLKRKNLYDKLEYPEIYYFMAGVMIVLAVDKEKRVSDSDIREAYSLAALHASHISLSTNNAKQATQFRDSVEGDSINDNNYDVCAEALTDLYKTHECCFCRTKDNVATLLDLSKGWEIMAYLIKGMKRASYYKTTITYTGL